MPQAMKYKIFDSEVKEKNDEAMTIEHFISTETRDRGGDVMRANGMKVKGRPVVLLQHGRTSLGAEPIAKPLWIKAGEYKRKKGIIAKTQFHDDEQGIGRRLYQKTVDGTMPNWSIGYIVNDYKDRRDFTEILDWELLEYSLVGVPMNPDAQTFYSKEYENMKTIYEDLESLIKEDDENEEQKEGFKSIDFKIFEDDIQEKPYPNEHACRLLSPDGWDRVRRQNNKFGDGIHAIYGIKDNTANLQAIRFDSGKFTADQARKWCKDHDHKCNPFEPAAKKEENNCQDCQTIDNSIFDKENLIKELINEMKEQGLIIIAPGETASGEKKDGESDGNNTREARRLVITDDSHKSKENAKELAQFIAKAFASSFKSGIRKLLGKVD